MITVLFIVRTPVRAVMNRNGKQGITMNRLTVQIYEIQEPSEAEAMLDLGVHCIGSVLVSGDNWKVPAIREVVSLVKNRGARSSLIPLFSERDLIFKVIDWYGPDVIHMCESLSDVSGISEKAGRLVRLQEEVKAAYPGLKIMRSVPIGETGHADAVPTLEIARMFEPASDLFLTDTLIVHRGGKDEDQPVQGFVGITGQTCDWEMARKLIDQSGIPVILAGGLSPSNVFDAVCATRPAGVDSCTQTNLLDRNGRPIRFRKDLEKVKTFVGEAHRAEAFLLENTHT